MNAALETPERALVSVRIRVVGRRVIEAVCKRKANVFAFTFADLLV